MNAIIFEGFGEVSGGLYKYLADKNYYELTEKDVISTKPAKEVKSPYKPLMIKVDTYFETGEISFKFNLGGDPDSACAIGINNNATRFSINSVYSSKLFSIQEWDFVSQMKLIDEQGMRGTLQPSQELKVRIEVFGSALRFFIDDVLVCSTNLQVKSSQVYIMLKSSKNCYVKDLKISSEKPKAFVVMQFTDSYNDLYKEVIKPVCEDFGYECIRGDEIFTNGSILKDIIDSLIESSIIIADITPDNPNVFYELGYAHALNKPTILLSDRKREKLPFDVSGFRTLFYDNSIGGKSMVESRLRKHLENLKKN